MIRIALRAVAVLAILLFAAVEGQAGGVGLYGYYGAGTASAERDSNVGEYTFDQKSTHIGGGVVYDSNVLETAPFNWRGAIGIERMDLEVDGGAGIFTDGLKSEYGGGIVVENDFGYGTKATPRTRLWGGLGTRLSFHTGEDGSYSGPRDQKVFGAGIGPVAGVNVGITGSTALCLKGGYLFSGYTGRWSDWTSAPVNKNRHDMSATEGNWFVSVALLFKTGDLSWSDGEEDEEAGGGTF